MTSHEFHRCCSTSTRQQLLQPLDSPQMATSTHIGAVVEMRLAGVRLQEAADALQAASARHLDACRQQ
jgi:hypothetical protein